MLGHDDLRAMGEGRLSAGTEWGAEKGAGHIEIKLAADVQMNPLQVINRSGLGAQLTAETIPHSVQRWPALFTFQRLGRGTK